MMVDVGDTLVAKAISTSGVVVAVTRHPKPLYTVRWVSGVNPAGWELLYDSQQMAALLHYYVHSSTEDFL